jgi:hypothetical protein
MPRIQHGGKRPRFVVDADPYADLVSLDRDRLGAYEDDRRLFFDG